MATTFANHLLDGIHASRPAATAVPEGTLYACSDHRLIYQSDGAAWATWSDVSGSTGATLTTKGDLLTRDASALARLGVGANDTVLTADSATATGLKWAAAVGGGGYDLVLNESGASFTNFTGLSGTWASDGAKIIQSATGGLIRRSRCDTICPVADAIVQVEVQLPTGGSAVRSGGLLIGWPGTDVTGYVYVAAVDDTANTFQVGRDAASSPINVAMTLALDTWYTLTARIDGARVAGYLDGTFQGAAFLQQANDTVAHFVGLRTYDGAVWFRNLKVWVPTLPA